MLAVEICSDTSRGRENQLRVGNAVILNEHYLQLALNRRIVVDNVRYAVDQLNGQLRPAVPCGSLGSEDKGSGIEIHLRMVFDLIVQIHYMKDVHQLSLILMKPLHLHVKDGSGIYFNAVVLFDVFCQTEFILIFDIHKLLLRFFVVRVNLHLADLGKIRDPLVSDMVGNPVGQKRIAVKQESSLGNPVRLVVELPGHHLIEVFQFLLFQNLRVESRDAVYRITGCNRQVRHFYLSVIDDGHLAHFLLISGIFLLDTQSGICG